MNTQDTITINLKPGTANKYEPGEKVLLELHITQVAEDKLETVVAGLHNDSGAFPEPLKNDVELDYDTRTLAPEVGMWSVGCCTSCVEYLYNDEAVADFLEQAAYDKDGARTFQGTQTYIYKTLDDLLADEGVSASDWNTEKLLILTEAVEYTPDGCGLARKELFKQLREFASDL